MWTNGAVEFVAPTFFSLRRQRGKTLWRRRTRVRQNRVVPAVVATVKLSRRCGAPNRVNRIVNSRERGRPEGIRLPGERGISRQTIAQGRPSDWHHLYAAVRFSCARFSRSRPRVRGQHPAFPAPSRTRGWTVKQRLGQNEPREREGVSAVGMRLEHWRCRLILRHWCESPGYLGRHL